MRDINKEEEKLTKLPHKIRKRLCHYLIDKNKCYTPFNKNQCRKSVSYCSKWKSEIDPFIRCLLINKKAEKGKEKNG
jgi:hypothetical protein